MLRCQLRRLIFLSLCVLASVAKDRSEARDNGSPDQLKRFVGQMIVTGFSGDNAQSPDFRRVVNNLESGVIGGVIFVADNIASKEELQTMITIVRNCRCDAVPFIAIDEEGGAVERLGEDIGLKPISSAAEIEHLGLSAAKTQYKLLARRLVGFGFNLNLAPVVDLNTNPSNPIAA